MEKKEPLLKGSIRAARNQVFFEERSVKGIEISYDGIKATMIPSCMSEELKTIFKKIKDEDHIDLLWDTLKNDKPKTVKEISGLNFDEISIVNDEYLRVRFSSETPSEFESKRDRIIEYLERNGINYGETDGSIACIWICVAKGRQTELTDEYLAQLDRLRSAQK